MPIDDAYATTSAYLARYSDRDAGLEDDLKAVSRYLDWKLNQEGGFNQDDAVTQRHYTGDGSRRLELRTPIASSTGLVVEVDEDNDGVYESTWTLDTHFQLHPLDAAEGPNPKPWAEMIIPSWSSKSVWPRGYGVRVTAIHGWPAVPAAITGATMALAAMLRLTSPWATQTISEIDVAVQASPQARSVLKGVMQQYNRYPVVVA